MFTRAYTYKYVSNHIFVFTSIYVDCYMFVCMYTFFFP